MCVCVCVCVSSHPKKIRISSGSSCKIIANYCRIIDDVHEIMARYFQSHGKILARLWGIRARSC